MLLTAILLVSGCAVLLLSYFFVLNYITQYETEQDKRAKDASVTLDYAFVEIERKRLLYIFILTPIGVSLVAYALSRSFEMALVALLPGLLIPTIIVYVMEKRRKAKFQAQLIDTVRILSSSLKAGLSLMQGLEVIMTEMPVPTSQEFAWVVKEVKFGVTLEDSLWKLYKRIPSEELTFLINSILVTRATGGDITKVLSKLAVTMRDNRKIKESVATLTLQGKLQAVLMCVIPVAFAWFVYSVNKDHFQIMLQTDIGRFLLIGAGIWLVIGIFMVYRFSIVKV